MIRVFTRLVFLSFFVLSCSTLAPVPTPTSAPTQTFTPIPTDTPSPTPTEVPTNTPQLPTETQDALSALRPVGTPDKEWKGIPIMPGAIAGSGDNEKYVFNIKAVVEDIQAYYERELSKSGWVLMTAGQSNGGAVMLIFNNGKPPLMPISIIPDGDLMIVLIVDSQ
ncbi:MAG TPA: hypothetical protein VKB04_13520 [Anaerolineales bacterium]|nr:hypothetical protein [Anaerolineales bacterium]